MNPGVLMGGGPLILYRISQELGATQASSHAEVATRVLPRPLGLQCPVLGVSWGAHKGVWRESVYRPGTHVQAASEVGALPESRGSLRPGCGTQVCHHGLVLPDMQGSSSRSRVGSRHLSGWVPLLGLGLLSAPWSLCASQGSGGSH